MKTVKGKRQNGTGTHTHARELDNGIIFEINISKNASFGKSWLIDGAPNVQLVLGGKLVVTKVMDGYAAIAVQKGVMRP